MARMLTRSMARNFPKKRFHSEPYPLLRRKKETPVMIVRRSARSVGTCFKSFLITFIFFNYAAIFYGIIYIANETIPMAMDLVPYQELY